MDYGVLIRRSWSITWRYRFLWVLGLFAATSVGSCSPSSGNGGVQYQLGPGDLGRISPDLERAFGGATFERMLLPNWQLILIGVALVLLLVLAFLIVSLIAQGSMAAATGDLSMNRPASLGAAWGSGLRLFWRYLALWALLIGVGILVVLALVVAAGLLVALASIAGEGPRVAFIVVGGLLGLLLLLIAIPVLIAVSVLVGFAQRAIALEDTGPLAALEAGLRLLRNNLGTSAIAWLINLGLSIGAGIAIGVGFVVLLIPLGGVTLILFRTVGVTVASVSYAVLAFLLVIAGSWVLAAIANTFFWNYWTMIYLRFTGRLTERLEPVVEP